MTDKEYRKHKKRIAKCIDLWGAPLGMKWWRMTYDYYDEPDTEGNAGRPVAARTLVDWDYMRATIKFYVPEFKSMDDADVERVVIHEMAHVLVNEMRQWQDASDAMSHEERVVSSLTSAFQWIRDAAKDGKL